MTLDRFIAAQDGTYARALAELRRGRKTSHWMWFIFPQIAGLGRSAVAQHYAIGSIDEARAYLAHPLLGPRLLEATAAMLSAIGTVDVILGEVDGMKFRSSMTLFVTAAHGDAAAPFKAALAQFFDRIPDPATLQRLGRSAA